MCLNSFHFAFQTRGRFKERCDPGEEISFASGVSRTATMKLMSFSVL